MRKLACLLVLAISGLLLIGGCAPRVHFPPKTSKSEQIFKTIYHNDSPEPLLLECLKRGSINLWENWDVIYPGESDTLTSRGGWETNCRIRFWSAQAGDFVGETMVDLPFRHSSLFNREVRITQLTLNRRSLQLGRVWNKSLEAMDVQDNYSNNYILAAGEERFYEVPSGHLIISYRPVNLKDPRISRWHKEIFVNNKPDSFWYYDPVSDEYKPMGWYVNINYFPGIWR